MKTVYLSFIMLLIFNGIIAKNNISKYDLAKHYSKHAKHKNLMLEKSKSINYPISLTQATENMATLVKQSFWDMPSNNWTESNANKLVVDNNKLITTIYSLSYSLTDTLGRTRLTYDNQGRTVVSIYENKNSSTGNWEPTFRFNFIYDTNNGIDKRTSISENYDAISSTWIYANKYIDAYDSKGYRIQSAGYIYNNNSWELMYNYTSKATYYNSNSFKVVEIIDSSYNTNTNTMDVDFKMTCSFDNQGREQEIKYYGTVTQGGSLILSAIDSLFYSTNNTPNAVVSIEYDEQGNILDKYKYTDIQFRNYNPNIFVFENQPTQLIFNILINNSYVPLGRMTTSYPDNFGSYIELVEEYINNNYRPAERYTETYNSNLEVIEEKYETYDTVSIGWITDFGNKYLLTYYPDNTRSELITQNYNTNTGAYVNSNKLEYSEYMLVNTSVNDSKKSEISIYPNPTNQNTFNIKHENFNAEESKLSIYSIKGEKIMEYDTILDGSTTTVHTDDLPKGIYILKMNNKNKVYTTKFIKE